MAAQPTLFCINLADGEYRFYYVALEESAARAAFLQEFGEIDSDLEPLAISVVDDPASVAAFMVISEDGAKRPLWDLFLEAAATASWDEAGAVGLSWPLELL